MKRNKATFKTENVAATLIQQFFSMRPQLYMLINQPVNSCVEVK